jgi:hypothetical protein
MIKAGEICERYLADPACARAMWSRAAALDPARADAHFYLAQHHRLRGDPAAAVAVHHRLAGLSIPPRDMFQWEYLYTCLRHLECLRAAAALPALRPADRALARAAAAAAAAGCPPAEVPEADTLLRHMEARAARAAPAAGLVAR